MKKTFAAVFVVLLLAGCDSPERKAFKGLMHEMKANQTQAFAVEQKFSATQAQDILKTYDLTADKIISRMGTPAFDMDVKARLGVVKAIVAKAGTNLDAPGFAAAMHDVDAQCKACHEKYN